MATQTKWYNMKMKTYWIYADLTIPADHKFYTPELEEWSVSWPITVRGKIPAYKDGRIRGTTPWIFIYCNSAYLLKQADVEGVEISNRKVLGKMR